MDLRSWVELEPWCYLQQLLQNKRWPLTKDWFKSKALTICYVTVMRYWDALPRSTRCSAHRRTPRCSGMTGHHIHPQHRAGPPAGRPPPRPGECWGRTQWSTCLSLDHTCNCNIRSCACFSVLDGVMEKRHDSWEDLKRETESRPHLLVLVAVNRQLHHLDMWLE